MTYMWLDEMGKDWTPGSAMECPDHGTLERVFHHGVLVAVRCATCGKQPIDLIADRPWMPTTRDWMEQELGGPPPLEFDVRADLGSIVP